MGHVIAVVALSVLSVVLFYLGFKGHISNQTLELLSRIAGIVSAITALIVLLDLRSDSASVSPAEYWVSVQRKGTENAIIGANVAISANDSGPDAETLTDSTGVAKLTLDSSLVGRSGLLLVAAAGYQTYSENIDIVARSRPHLVHLEAIPGPTETRVTSDATTGTPTPSPMSTVTVTPSPTPTYTPVPSHSSICPYHGATTEETLVRLIQAEGEASEKKSDSVIATIFSDDAVIKDAAERQIWCDPFSRYRTLFEEVDSITVERFAIQPVGSAIPEEAAWFTSGNTTTIGPLATTWRNQGGSDHWTFGRDEQGCWRVTEFAFNASHDAFPAPTPPETSTGCFCQSTTDAATLFCLIHAESAAANAGDLALIGRIFAPDAEINRGDTPDRWYTPGDYYQPTFAALKYKGAEHFDIEIIEIDRQMARLTSGSWGCYVEPGGKRVTYSNINPSDHWTFRKNDSGCWVITEFEFNARHLAFPR